MCERERESEGDTYIDRIKDECVALHIGQLDETQTNWIRSVWRAGRHHADLLSVQLWWANLGQHVQPSAKVMWMLNTVGSAYLRLDGNIVVEVKQEDDPYMRVLLKIYHPSVSVSE